MLPWFAIVPNNEKEKKRGKLTSVKDVEVIVPDIVPSPSKCHQLVSCGHPGVIAPHHRRFALGLHQAPSGRFYSKEVSESRIKSPKRNSKGSKEKKKITGIEHVNIIASHAIQKSPKNEDPGADHRGRMIIPL